jgi:EAL and modified HD-GYP domain-containing signal transduction protein
MEGLIEIADYIKVDVLASDAAARREIHSALNGSAAALLAEKVEGGAEFEITRAEGYEYFQGYFFCRPKTVAGREVPPNRMNYLRLLAELARRPMDFEAVRQIVRSEPSLLYRLLRLANSPVAGRSGKVTSIHDALMLVGEERFRTLVSVAAMAAMGHGKPEALLHTALERAHFCEALGPLLGLNSTEQFLLGLLSVVDAMLDLPIETVAEAMPLRAEAKAALLSAKGSLATPLCLVRELEAGIWVRGPGVAQTFGIEEHGISQLYLEAVDRTSKTLNASR